MNQNLQEDVIKIEHLKKGFGNNVVLRDLNLELKKGENLVVLGRSGSGKSVLIKCIVRLIEPDNGRIEVLGKNICELRENELNVLRKQVGFLFQNSALYDSMNVRKNLEFPLRKNKAKYSRSEIDQKVFEALVNVGLIEAIDKMPSELSGGMRKRIGLARTLILNPEIMLYDEPTTGLDPVTSREISDLILEIRKKYNTSSIIITHDIGCAKITADRIIVLKDGINKASGSFEELTNSPHEWVRAFFEIR